VSEKAIRKLVGPSTPAESAQLAFAGMTTAAAGTPRAAGVPSAVHNDPQYLDEAVRNEGLLEGLRALDRHARRGGEGPRQLVGEFGEFDEGRERDCMKRPSTKKTVPTAKHPKDHTWYIYHIKGTPAALLGHVEAPDEETAIKKAIEQFAVSPVLQTRLLAQQRDP
jgi:hypothetical protein